MNTGGLTPISDSDLSATVRGLVAGQRVLGRYVLRKVLGRGGMGVVWLAYDEKLEITVAIKFLPELFNHDKATLQHLIDETRRSLRLNHAHIVRIFDFVQDENCAGITMEYIDGDTLSNLRVERSKRVFETAELAPWVAQLCDVLTYAHEEAFVAHRDLKPANLMITRRGLLKVTDFGISRSLSDTMTRRTMAAQGASGTLVYMSPQQAMGDAVSALDDIYSFGSTVYELLTSKPPFYSGEILAQVREKIAPSMSSRRTELGIIGDPIPQVWEDTIAACLAKDPAKRPKNAREIKERLGLADPARVGAAGPITDHVVPALVVSDTGQLKAPSSGALSAWPSKEYQPVVVSAERRRKHWMITSALLALVLLGMWIWSGPDGRQSPGAPATIVLNSVPPGAEVRERGSSTASLGVTPLPLTIPSGNKSFEFLLPGYYPALLATNLSAGTNARLEVELERLRGAVQLTPVPAEAEIRLDGTAVPVGALRPTFGTHTLEVALPGYRTVSRELTISNEVPVDLGTISLQQLTGLVRVPATPVGATYRFKGATGFERTGLLSAAPLELSLPVGDYSLNLSAEGFLATNLVLHVREDETNQVSPVALVQLFGGLEVRGEPAGSGFTLLGASKREGRLPATFEHLPVGRYHVVMDQEGYDPVDRIVTVIPDRVTAEEFQLVRSLGNLFIQSQPSVVDYELTGAGLATLRGQTPAQINELPVGNYTLRLHYKQWAVTNQVMVTRGDNRPAPMEFPIGRVRIVTEPRGATVLANGQELGLTPLDLDELPVGPVVYELRRPGYRYASVRGTVVAQRTNVLRTTLVHYNAPQAADTVWTNSLGMRFVRIGGIWMSVWDTRVKDYSPFASAGRYTTGQGWNDPGFKQSPTHPVVNVSWDDAQAYCRWLTETEHADGMIPDFEYRLPTDLEWSTAFGLSDNPNSTPVERERASSTVYLWGDQWPPPVAVANLAQLTTFDPYPETSPVGSFRPNPFGLYDMIGNVWQWCLDPYDATGQTHVLRGESWQPPISQYQVGYRRNLPHDERSNGAGFRCVLVPVKRTSP